MFSLRDLKDITQKDFRLALLHFCTIMVLTVLVKQGCKGDWLKMSKTP